MYLPAKHTELFVTAVIIRVITCNVVFTKLSPQTFMAAHAQTRALFWLFLKCTLPRVTVTNGIRLPQDESRRLLNAAFHITFEAVWMKHRFVLQIYQNSSLPKCDKDHKFLDK